MPVSPLTTSAARATRSHSAPRSVRPARTRSPGSPAARATASARSRSAAEPVISTGASGSSSAAATAANRSTGQRFAPNAAPGCTRTGAGPPVRPRRGPAGSRRRSSGIGRDPGGLQERAPSGPLVRVGRGDRVPLGTLPARARLRTAEPDAPRRFEGVERAVALRAGAVQVHGDVRGGAGPRHRIGRGRVGRRHQGVDAADPVDQRRERRRRREHEPVLRDGPGAAPAGPAPRRAGRRSATRAVREGWVAGRPPRGTRTRREPVRPGALPRVADESASGAPQAVSPHDQRG